jgi:hypothetical protein
MSLKREINNMFKFRLKKRELKDILQLRRIAFASIAAIMIHFLLLPVINLPWEGWNVLITVLGAMIFAEWLD